MAAQITMMTSKPNSTPRASGCINVTQNSHRPRVFSKPRHRMLLVILGQKLLRFASANGCYRTLILTKDHGPNLRSVYEFTACNKGLCDGCRGASKDETAECIWHDDMDWRVDIAGPRCVLDVLGLYCRWNLRCCPRVGFQ